MHKQNNLVGTINNAQALTNHSQTHLFEARRLSQQRGSHISQKPPNLASSSTKNNLIDGNATGKHGTHGQFGGNHHSHQHPQSVSNSLSQSKRISFSELQSANGGSNNVVMSSNDGGNNLIKGTVGADEAKKLYCIFDSRKNSQSSLQNIGSIGQNLNQV